MVRAFFALSAGFWLGILGPMLMPNASQPAPAPRTGLHPELIIAGATVRTLDPAQPTAEAIAVLGGKIAAVGGTETILSLAGSGTRVIHAQGRLVLPGFNDAHVHFLSGGFQLSQVPLRESSSPEDFTDRLQRFAETQPPGAWITGGDWDHERWAGSPLPTREWLDQATTNHPVFVRRLDGHMAVANSVALRLAKVTEATPAPPGGEIVKSPADGRPTGVLKDAAMDLVYRHVPEPSFEEKLRAAQAATDYAAGLGVTSVQDMSAGADVGVYQALWHRGTLKTRIYAVWPLPRWEELARTGVRAGFGPAMLRTGGLKGFSDGSLGSTTALFFEPYQDAPGTSGLPSDELIPIEAMRQRVAGADAAGLQVMVHAIGDKANDIMLAIFEETTRAHGAADRRFRIEHAQHLRLSDIPRFVDAKIIASMQPYHAADDGRWAEKRIGAERCRGTYAFRSLLETGATLAFGSDWTVAPLDPLPGLVAAVTRRTLDGQHPDGWIPEQKITLEQAIHAYTIGSAKAEFADHLKGTIKVGMLADLVIWSHDLFSMPAGDLEEASAWLTIVDGRVVFESEAN